MSPKTQSSRTGPGYRRHVSQACDACKRRKTKCDGLRPCERCSAAESDCQYSGEDRRLIRRAHRGSRVTAPSPSPTESPETCPSLDLMRPTSRTLEVSAQSNFRNHKAKERIQEDLGDTSTHSFLKRIYGRLSLMGKRLPRNIINEEEDIQDCSDLSPLVLPDRSKALEYLDCFFDHLNGTYRYLSRNEMYNLLDRVYDDDPSVHDDPTLLALFLSVIGSGCLWTASWRSRNMTEYRKKAFKLLSAAKPRLRKATSRFPPTLTVIQAHFAYCSALVASHKYNSAWMMLGTTIRLSQIVGLSKDATNLTPLENFKRRGLFWGIFVMDRYLSIILGRAFGVSENDITLPLPEPPTRELEAELGAEEGKLIPGTCAHIKLMKIASRTMNQLYGANTTAQEPKERIVADIEVQLVQWLKETPEFFHPPQNNMQKDIDSSFYSIPWLLLRQRNTVRCGYYFTQMLLYRDFLLRDFMTCVPRMASPLLDGPSALSQSCIQAALSMARMADEFSKDETYNPVFWATSHLIFCSVAILVVSMILYEDNAGLEAVIEKAMKAHLKLSTSDRTQQHILLEESRSIAKTFTGEANVSMSNLTVRNSAPLGSHPYHQQENPWKNNTNVIGNLDGADESNNTHPLPCPPFEIESGQGLAGMDFNMDPIGADPVGYDITHGSPENMFNLGSSLLMDLGFDSSEFRSVVNSGIPDVSNL